MIPVIAIVGRPNVGKSTLFNQLTRSRDALVADIPGLTRDRQYGEARFEGQDFWVIDTGGLSGDEEGIDEAMAEQSLLAVSEADAVLFVVDGRNGVSPGDQEIAARLRVIDKPIWLVVNKTDGIDEDIALADFYGLLALQPLAIAASHGKGVHQLQREFLSHPLFQQESEITDDVESGIKIGIIGRPNVGKSTLVNRMLGEERVVVFDQAGTTRDSIYIPYERHGERYTVIDTAGVRRRGKVDGIVEKFSVVKTMKAINDAHVILLVVDARDNLVEQDLHLLGAALQAGRALVIAVNKWDGMDIDDKEAVKKELERRLEFIPYATTHFISAKHGTGVGNLYKSIHAAYESAGRKLNTHQLTEVLLDAVQDHQPPSVHGRRIKLRYAHPAGNFPPKVIIHGNQVDKLPTAYMRYLENTFRRVLKLKGTPIRIETKTHENPFAGKKNSLSERQEEKRRRHRRFIKSFKR